MALERGLSGTCDHLDIKGSSVPLWWPLKNSVDFLIILYRLFYSVSEIAIVKWGEITPYHRNWQKKCRKCHSNECTYDPLAAKGDVILLAAVTSETQSWPQRKSRPEEYTLVARDLWWVWLNYRSSWSTYTSSRCHFFQFYTRPPGECGWTFFRCRFCVSSTYLRKRSRVEQVFSRIYQVKESVQIIYNSL